MARKEYEMTEADLDELLRTSRSVARIGQPILEDQLRKKRLDEAWEALGKRMGFDPSTVSVNAALGPRFFWAESTIPVEMVRVPNTELTRLIAVAAVLDEKWPDTVRGIVNHLSSAMLARVREVGMRLVGLADDVERRNRLGL